MFTAVIVGVCIIVSVSVCRLYHALFVYRYFLSILQSHSSTLTHAHVLTGHCDFYSEDMFKPIAVEDEMYQIKPMNCPCHCLIYKDAPRSYRDLPIRWAELGE